MTNQNIKKLVTAALLAAMTCVATMIIKIPTPTFGYIHPGDGFVLVRGVVLGPLPGALAAGLLFHRFKNTLHSKKGRYAALAIGGIVGEAIMVIGYFLYETGLAALGSGALNQASIAAGIASSATGIPFNIVQGVVGIILSLILLPVLSKIPDVRDWIER